MATPTLTDDGKVSFLTGYTPTLNGGHIRFLTAGGAEAARVTLNATAFGAPSGTGTVTATAGQTPALQDADADGQAASDVTLADVYESDDTKQFRVSVTAKRVYEHDIVAVSA